MSSTRTTPAAAASLQGLRPLPTPGGAAATSDADIETLIQTSPWQKFQMPTYHLTTPFGQGVTLANIGVGPSNAKTMTDHLAVLRPHAWLMVGHCGGLRQSQQIGDYVLAHGYLREDGILDSVVPTEMPIPALAEVQVALQEAAASVTGDRGEALKIADQLIVLSQQGTIEQAGTPQELSKKPANDFVRKILGV